jgi:hypothetical protein
MYFDQIDNNLEQVLRISITNNMSWLFIQLCKTMEPYSIFTVYLNRIFEYGSIIKTLSSFDTNFKPKNFSKLNDRHFKMPI